MKDKALSCLVLIFFSFYGGFYENDFKYKELKYFVSEKEGSHLASR